MFATSASASSHGAFAEVIGYLGGAFLLGIAAHSVWPTQSFGMIGIAVAMTISAMMIVLGRPGRFRFIGWLCLFLVLGFWRFESALGSMPRGLRAFEAKGLAHATAFAATADPSDPRHWLGIGKRLSNARAAQQFSPDESALLTGMLYGERAFSKSLNDRFRRAGLLHLVAVSGSNVTILATLMLSFFLFCRLHRRHAFAIMSFVLLAFVLFVGASASVVRAAIMGWLIELAPIVGRIPRPSRLLLISAVAFVAWQPWALLFDASFALSFLAMWGLLAWTSTIDASLARWISWTTLRSIMAATLGATLMTIPYAAWAFGQVTLFGFVTSALALPLVPWVMLVGTLAIITGSVVFIFPTRGFLQAILWIARIPDAIGFGYWSHLSTPAIEMYAWYALLLVFWFYFQRKKRLIHHREAKNTENLSNEVAR